MENGKRLDEAKKNEKGVNWKSKYGGNIQNSLRVNAVEMK